MSPSPRDLIKAVFKAVEAKDPDAVTELFAEDGVVIDPHYPSPRMEGRAAIAKGLGFSLSKIKTFGFTITGSFLSADGKSASFEVKTRHVPKLGAIQDSWQVFVLETHDGLITRLQAYQPYGPHGILGFILGFIRFWQKLTGRS